MFYQLYYNLIKQDFHSESWKQEIDVIFKKSNKDDSADPKSYRLISLLNCLDKISKRIIAERLSFYAETTDLIYNDQIDSKKQKSAIDAVMTLVADIELNKQKKQLSSAFFMNIKDAYSHLNKIQLLKICCKIKLSFAYIKWIQSFCYIRTMKLISAN